MENKKYGEIIFTHDQIVAACKKLASKINKKFKNSKIITVVGILKGSIPFMAELIKHITLDIRLDFITATSYQNNKQSGELKIIMDLSHSVIDHDVIIIEDICDSGLTLNKITSHIKSKGPKSLSTVVLINKPEGRENGFKPDFIGLTLEKKVFIVGFGFDDDGFLRNLPFIAKSK